MLRALSFPGTAIVIGLTVLLGIRLLMSRAAWSVALLAVGAAVVWLVVQVGSTALDRWAQ